jgi:hypothetical protein
MPAVSGEPQGALDRLLRPSPSLLVLLLALILTGTIGELVLSILVLEALRQ